MMRAQFNLTATVFDKRGRILATGQNSYSKTHPVQHYHAVRAGRPGAIFLHAEIDALRKVSDKKKIHKIRVERYTKDGRPALAKPCNVCSDALSYYDVEHIEYTDYEDTN